VWLWPLFCKDLTQMRLITESTGWKLILSVVLLVVVLGFKFLSNDDKPADSLASNPLDETAVQAEQTPTSDTPTTQIASSSTGFDRSSSKTGSKEPQQSRTSAVNPIAKHTDQEESIKHTSTTVEGEEFLASGDEVDTTVVFEQWLNETFDNPDGSESGSKNLTTPNAATASTNDSDEGLASRKDETNFSSNLNLTTPTTLEVQSKKIETTEFTIAGRVVSTSGSPLQGLVVSAQSRGGLPAEQTSAIAKSGDDGSFSLSKLVAGDYMVRVEGDESHDSSVQILRAGDMAARIILVELKQWQVEGQVIDNLGAPIAGVTVRPPAGTEPTTTDASGFFSMNFEARDSGGLLLRFEAEGFTSAMRHIVGNDLKSQGVIDASVQLQSSGILYLSGSVTDDLGEPVPKAYVNLQSRNPAFELGVHTDNAGFFALPGIAPTNSASVKVNAGNQYQPFVMGNLSLQEDYNLNVTLQKTALSSLVATVTDSEGNGVSSLNFLSLSSAPAATSQIATSDSEGMLVVDNIKPGKLILRSTAKSPSIVIKGIEVIAGAENQHDIVVDVGPYTLQGRLLDENGNPVADADLNMVHVISENGIESVTTRNVKSKDDGSFVFSGLGTGERYLTVASRTHDEQSFAMDPSVETNGEPLVLY